MNKLRFYLPYVILSALIGVVIEVTSAIILERGQISIKSMIGDVQASILIGCVSIFCVSQAFIKFKKELAVGLTINSFVVGLMVLGFYILEGMQSPSDFFDFHWIIVFAVAETLSMGITISFYRQLRLYNKKLEQKKESLKK